ncbi:hypothetical protein LTR56_028082 [Elasticomyces elasticus]|nr:hypothetical protein LTR56_028082 [Elasticomyces elasticus]
MSGPVDVLKQGLAESGDFADFEITCGYHTFKVHKPIVCAQSKYFRAPCGHEYMEGQTGKIELKAIGESYDNATCDDPEAIKLMIDFFYHLDYDAEPVELTPTLDMPEPPEPLLSLEEPVLTIHDHDLWSNFASTRKSKRCTKCGLPGDRSNVGKHTAAATKSTVDDCERSDANMVTHAKVFAAAVKYQIPALQKLAASKFGDSATETN